MEEKRIWLSPPHMGGKEINFIHQAFKQNWIAPLGENVDMFEKELAQYLNIPYVTVLSSGTAAIHLALIILGIKQNDEVICSTFTFSASVNPILYLKAIPVFVDSEELSWNMSPELLEKAIKDRIKKGKKPGAIILVHLYGMPAMIDEIIKIAANYEIPVIEDAAEALGSKYKNIHVGCFGQIGILSFNGNKIITTGGGGALISKNKDFVDKARFLATQARDPAPHYQHSQIGYNYRLSNILAGIGRGQLLVLNKWLAKRRQNYNFYYQHLAKIKGINFQPEPDFAFANRWLTAITINPKETNGITREHIRLTLQKHNIEARPLWKPMHLQPVFKHYPAYLNLVSEKLFENGLCLPSGSNLSENDKYIIINYITQVLNN